MDAKVLPIELDWRFGIVERLGRVRMKELMDFHDQSRRYVSLAPQALFPAATGTTGFAISEGNWETATPILSCENRVLSQVRRRRRDFLVRPGYVARKLRSMPSF